MSVPLTLGLLLVCGLLAGLLASRLGLPRVTAYVLTGVAFSPGFLGGSIELHTGPWAEPLTTSALAVVAYLIGGSMTVSQLRRIGKVIAAAAVGESLGAVVLVFLGVLILAPAPGAASQVQLAAALAAIAATTAPATTVAVLHEYRAAGPVSTVLLGVVALDDALGIILFSLMMVLATGGSALTILGTAVSGVVLSVLLGLLAALLLSKVSPSIHQKSLLLPMLLGTVLIVVGAAHSLELPPLLAAMTLGFATRYFAGAAGDRMFDPVEGLEEAVFIVFFTLAGLHFEMNVFFPAAATAAVYLFARVAGKLAGARVGARLGGGSPEVVRWLGLGLIPQAGVAVGLALTLGQHPAFSSLAATILNVVLATTVFYEVFGPLAVRFALKRAGEIADREPFALGVGEETRP